MALALVVAGCAAPERMTGPPDAAPETPQTQPNPAPPPPSVEEENIARLSRLACEEVTVAAVGDLMLGTDFPEDRLPDDDGAGQLTAAGPWLRAADIAFGNLEGVLMDGGEPVKACKNASACYLFRSPQRFARTFADAGFTALSLANNHAYDFGRPGRTASMAALDSVGIHHSGRAGELASWKIGEARIAMVAFAPFKESWPMLDQTSAVAVVSGLAVGHDIVIVSFHGGAEGVDAARIPFSTERYYGEDRGNVVEFARAMIDAGADLLLGHGPHVPRAVELYRDRFIAYSLGNFATWWGISIANEKGYAPLLSLKLDGNGRFLGGEVVSFVQGRPEGPRLDPANRAAVMTGELTAADFPGGELKVQQNGQISRTGGTVTTACQPPQAAR